MTIKVYYVYALVDPRDNLPFYIGAGSGRRIRRHFESSRITRATAVYRRIQQLLQLQKTPEQLIVIGNISREVARTWERGLISEIGRQDQGTGPLLNMSRGFLKIPQRMAARLPTWEPRPKDTPARVLAREVLRQQNKAVYFDVTHGWLARLPDGRQVEVESRAAGCALLDPQAPSKS